MGASDSCVQRLCAKVFWDTAWEGGWRNLRMPTALSPVQEHSGTVSIIWGRKKNKSAFYMQLNYPEKTSPLSWLPQLSHDCLNSQGA